MPTDTIYGVVGSALNPKTVDKIYNFRKRDISKPMIILISAIADLKKFGIVITSKQRDFLNKNWPNPVSVILPCPGEKFAYLHRGKKSLAFRQPKNGNLRKLLKETGPLVAPSANPEKEKPAETIEEAKNYFGNKMAFYTDAGELKSKPSTIVRLYEDGKCIIVRQGTYKILI